MHFLFEIILIIIIINLSNGKNELERKIQYLEKILKDKKIDYNYEKKSKTQNVEYQHQDETIENQEKEYEDYIEDIRFEKNKYDIESKEYNNENIFQKKKKLKVSEQEKKNIIILIIGAICIVLSAIVFLVSTWYTMDNVLKTFVLVLVTVVFLGCSYIAKNKLKLEKSSKAFFYIAMAYIPICLISLSIFELLGTYLSINGEGKYIYLALCGIFISIIYYQVYIKYSNKYILFGSMLSQMLSVILFSLILSNNILLIIVNLLIYNICLVILTKRDIFEKIYRAIPFVIPFFLIGQMCKESTYMILALGLLTINFIILEFKYKEAIFGCAFNISLTIFGVYTILMCKSFLTLEVCDFSILVYVLLIYIIENILFIKTIKEYYVLSSTITTLIILPILYIQSCCGIYVIPSYLVSLISVLILTNIYLSKKDIFKQISSILIPIYLIITVIDIILKFSLPYHAYMILAFSLFIVGEIFRNRDEMLHNSFFIISQFWLIITYIFVGILNYEEFNNDIIYIILLLSVHIYSGLTKKNILFKYTSYFILNFVLLSGFNLLGQSYMNVYVPMITSIALIVSQTMYKKLKDDISDIYLLVSQIVAFGLLYNINDEFDVMLYFIFACILIIYNLINKKEEYNIIPFVALIPLMFYNNLLYPVKILLITGYLLITLILSLNKRKLSINTLFSFIYLVIMIFNIKNIYIRELLFSVWLLLNSLFMKKEKLSDVFKAIFCISLLPIYNRVIFDLQIDKYTVFKMLGFIVETIILTRYILIKYTKNIEVLEYLILGAIYLLSIMKYNDEKDGIMFCVLVILILLISYMKKYGSIFMISALAIIVNIFLLTREFWFSIPWWIYLLLVGTVLLAFAMKNESKENKKIDSILKNIKSKIDKR